MPMTTTPAIDVTDLVRTYGDYTAVKGLNFHVQRGEVFGLLGTNGAGKTRLGSKCSDNHHIDT